MNTSNRTILFWLENIFIFGALIKTSATFLNKNEKEIIFNLIQEFQIHHCVFVLNHRDSKNVVNIKKLFFNDVFTMVLNHSELMTYINRYDDNIESQSQIRHFNTMIVLKENNGLSLEKILLPYDDVSTLRSLSNSYFVNNRLINSKTKLIL